MAGIIRMTRSFASSIGNVFASLFGNVFAWFWFSALLITVGAFLISAPIEVAGPGGRSLFQVAAVIGGFLLVGVGASWAWHKLGEERQRIAMRVGESLGGLIIFAAIVAVAAWSWWSWQVPDIWNRPLAAVTLGDIAQNAVKLGVMFLGLSFVSGVFRKLMVYWRTGRMAKNDPA
jgi:hypothetical protein